MKIKIGFWGIFMLLALLIGNPSVSLPSLMAVTLHELGHIGMARLCRIPLSELKLGLFGAGLVPVGSIPSYGKEILLCISGPFVNVITFLFLHGTGVVDHSVFLEILATSSLALGIFNLLPIEDFDGGRILKALASLLLSPSFAERVVRFFSFCITAVLWSLSLYLLLRTSNSLSLFVFSLFLFIKLFKVAS